jgi:hypothetical protein
VSTDEQQLTTDIQQPPTDDQRPTTDNQQPTTNDQRPTTNDQQLTTDDQQPTTDDQRPTNDDQPAAEELKYSQDRAWQHQRPTYNMFKVWQNSAPFDSRPIGNAVEALLTKAVNW